MDTPILSASDDQIEIRFGTLRAGDFSLSDVGLDDNRLKVPGGNLRLVLAFDTVGGAHFFRAPTFVLAYDKPTKDVAWQCQLNDVVVHDAIDHSGSTTVFTVDRHKLERALRDKGNMLVIRADFPDDVTLKARESHFHILETPGTDPQR